MSDRRKVPKSLNVIFAYDPSRAGRVGKRESGQNPNDFYQALTNMFLH